MKRCIDCKHHMAAMDFPDMCMRDTDYFEVPDLVRGGTRTVNRGGFSLSAEDERTSILPWKCGRKARYFQPKESA
jgi:hypothetical protein